MVTIDHAQGGGRLVGGKISTSTKVIEFESSSVLVVEVRARNPMARKEGTKRKSTRPPDFPLGGKPLNSLFQRSLLFHLLHPRLPSRNRILPPPPLDLFLVVMRNPRSLVVQFVFFAFGWDRCRSLFLVGEEGWNVFARCGGGSDIFARLGRSVEREHGFG